MLHASLKIARENATKEAGIGLHNVRINPQINTSVCSQPHEQRINADFDIHTTRCNLVDTSTS